MNGMLSARPAVARKKSDDGDKPKRYGTQIRVSSEFAEVITRAASLEGLSVAEFASLHLKPTVEKRYREALARETKRLGGEGR